MSEFEIKVSELKDSPWRFKVISSKDFDNLVNVIETYGPHTTNPILVTKIDGRYYIVDGHARRDAISEAGFNKARCVIAEWIRNLNDLRVWSFRLNRQGHYNPLELLRMVKEDINVFGSMEKVSEHYGVSQEYVENLLKLDALDGAAKVMIDKVIDIARKRYQFVLEQINTYQLSNIAELEPEQQIGVLEWLFHDIMYGPPNESLVSLPSIYEVIAEIENHKSKSTTVASKVVHNKHRSKECAKDIDQLEFSCSCGNKFHVDFSIGEVCEYVEEDNLIIKKKVETIHTVSDKVSEETESKNQSKHGRSSSKKLHLNAR